MMVSESPTVLLGAVKRYSRLEIVISVTWIRLRIPLYFRAVVIPQYSLLNTWKNPRVPSTFRKRDPAIITERFPEFPQEPIIISRGGALFYISNAFAIFEPSVITIENRI
jgi:hypothetical protein